MTKPDATSNAVLTVIRTAGKELPKPPARGAWLWLSTTAPSAELASRAVLAGALDVLSVDEPRMLSKLVARATEASVGEPIVPECLGFVARSEPGRRVLRDVLRAAKTSMPVLLTGETGTGKELVARLAS